MKLSKFQIKICENLLKDQGQVLSLKTLIYRRLPKWSLITGAGIASAFIWFYLGIYSLAYGMVGLVIGSVLSDFGLVILSNKLSPIMVKIIDYRILERALKSKEI